jgi:uncharacterized protein YkwD
MKSFVRKSFTVGLLMAVIIIVYPQLTPLIDQAFPPPAVNKPEAVLPPLGVRYLEKVEELAFDMTNQARRARGLAPLSKDVELTNMARAYSDDMMVRRFFDHTTPDGVSFDERFSIQYRHRVYAVGENIWCAVGYNPDKARQLAKEIVDDWLSSPDHRDNLLDPDFTHLGVGISVRHHTIRATQEFVGKSKAFDFGAIVDRLLTGTFKSVISGQLSVAGGQ